MTDEITGGHLTDEITGRRSTDEFTVRAEAAGDRDEVRRVNEVAFGQPQEAALVDALRAAARTHVSLVAEAAGRVVGHIFFSPVTVEAAGGGSVGEPVGGGGGSGGGESGGGRAGSPLAAMGLAPMAVAPGWQGRGVGSRLVWAGLAECARAGFAAVFVVGHADYYPRFGFRPAGPLGFGCEYDVPEEVFMVTELVPGALAGRAGLVKYHPAFAAV